MQSDPAPLIDWLVDILEATDWRMRPLDILDTERRYPGLMNNLATMSWQRRLIAEQMESTNENAHGNNP